ncbi:MAG: hypothetical protein ACI31V_02130 [Bacilli bacterium]
MNKSIKKVLVGLMFLACLNTVKAGYYTKVSTTDLYKKCNNETGCIPLCIYEAKNDGAWVDGKERAFIGFFPETESNPKSNWQIATLEYDYVALFEDYRLPHEGIYWENYGNQTSWSETEAYKNISEYFECPEYFYIDKKNNIELCFANETNKCESQDKAFVTDFGYGQPLKYNFLEEELKPIINDTYNELYIFDSTTSAMINNPTKYPAGADTIEQLEKEKVKFLSEVDPNLKGKYDASKTARENATNYCSILAETVTDEKTYSETLDKKLMNEYTNLINQQLQKSAVKFNSKNANIYTIEKLASILSNKDESGNRYERQIIDPQTNTTYIDKLNSIYSLNVDSSVKYVVNICNNMTETNIEYNGETLKENLKEEFTTKIYEKITFDDKTQFSCGTLGELADLVKTGYFIIEIVALVILVVFTVLDYAKVILSGEKDEMKKTNKRLSTRLIVMVVILLLPALINFVLGVFNIEGFNSENPLCVEIKNK